MEEEEDTIEEKKEGDFDEEIEEDTDDEGFMDGYGKDEEVEECAECGAAIKEKKKVTKELEGESYSFCSQPCANDFEESMAKKE